MYRITVRFASGRPAMHCYRATAAGTHQLRGTLAAYGCVVAVDFLPAMCPDAGDLVDELAGLMWPVDPLPRLYHGAPG